MKFDVAKTAILCFLMHRASRFSSPDIPKNRSYSDHLSEMLTEDEHWVNAINYCNWLKPLKKPEAVGELYVP